MVKFSEKKSMLEKFRANVLKDVRANRFYASLLRTQKRILFTIISTLSKTEQKINVGS